MITLSIVLVTYNAEKYIRQALDSVFYQKIEDGYDTSIFIYDDCSSDKTLDIIRQNIPFSPWPVIIRNSPVNIGITKNYKRIFEDIQTDYVAVLEGDDYWSSPYHIMQHLNILERHFEASMSVNSFIGFKYEGNILITNPPTLERDCYYSFRDIIKANHIGNFSSCMFRGNLLKQINPSLWEVDVPNVDDWLIGIEMSKYGLIAELSEVTTMYRLNPKSAWSSLSQKDKEDSIHQRYYEYMKYLGGDYIELAEKDRIEYYNKYHIAPIISMLASFGSNLKAKLIVFGGMFLSKNVKIKMKKE